MADIKLVIKMPEEMYAQIIDENGIDTMLIPYKDIIKNGTPLPKGHGDLIDRSEVIKSLFDFHKGKKTIGQCIDDVQTIIEADKEQAEGNDD